MNQTQSNPISAELRRKGNIHSFLKTHLSSRNITDESETKIKQDQNRWSLVFLSLFGSIFFC